MGDNNFFSTQEKEPEISIISWVENEEWKKKPDIVARVKDCEDFKR